MPCGWQTRGVWPEREDTAIDTAGPIMLALGAIGVLRARNRLDKV